mmetsp:Transcript_20450/g.72329  ORF Transcript_20450/g.72329 Transcript_20450/m.72329 type:complete len:162 (-) Transcript_20450:47-532(-)
MAAMTVQCVCVIQGEGVKGTVALSQLNEDAPVEFRGEIRGLSEGAHAFALHEWGDVTSGGASTGKHYNPFGRTHGAPGDEDRQVGDLGNLEVGKDGVAVVNIDDRMVKLIGPFSVIGRSLVVYEFEDDYGRGGKEMSLVNGNAGSVMAAGVIGLAAPGKVN